MVGHHGRSRLLLAGLAAVLWPTSASASDMAILAFFVSFPVCVGLVGLTFLLAALIPPSAAPVLAVPIAALVGIHLYLLPNMLHGEELLLFAIQAAISATSLLAFRSLKKRQGE